MVDSNKRTVHITLGKDSSYILDYGKYKIYIEYNVELHGDAENEMYKLYTYTTDNTLLREFIDDITKQHKDFVNFNDRDPCKFTITKNGWTRYNVRNLKTFDNLVMNKNDKDSILKDIEHFFNNEEWYIEKGIPWTRGYLLHGIPGTGKSSMIKAISNKFRLDMYCMNLSSISSDMDIINYFNELPERCLLVLEDIDCMTSAVIERTITPDESTTFGGITLSGLLNELDGITNAHGRIMCMTTNHVDKIDKALIRPGRIDMRIEFTRCSVEVICLFFKFMFDDELTNYGFIMDGLKDDVVTPATLSNIFTYPKRRAMDELMKVFDIDEPFRLMD